MRTFIGLLAMLFFGSSCEKEQNSASQPKVIKLSAEQFSLVDASNRFAFDLVRQVNKSEKSDVNLFISPMSVHMALGMAWNGAAGNTKTEMSQTLYFPSLTDEKLNVAYSNLINELLSADEKVEMKLANSIWYRNTFWVKKNFLDINKNYFKAEVTPLDFANPQAKDIINSWVAQKTNNRIKTIIDNINNDHVMFLINAIYFKGSWQNGFKTSETQNSTFYLMGGSTRQVMTMQNKSNYSLAVRPGYQVIELLYGRGNFSMLVFLPDQGKTPDQVIESLTSEQWNSIATELAAPREIHLRFPRFGFSFEKQLKDMLMAMGMKDAFNELKANFSNITDQQIFVSAVKHKSFVEVNEEGTEAAAATSVDFSVTSMPLQTNFYVNRPFVFALKEKSTNALLFIGKVMDPSLQ